MGFKGAKRMTADEQRDMNALFDLISRTNKKPAKDSTAILEEQFREHQAPGSNVRHHAKDGMSLVQLNAIRAKQHVVTVHKLEPSSIIHSSVGSAIDNYSKILSDIG
jgi:hypothetical protein